MASLVLLPAWRSHDIPPGHSEIMVTYPGSGQTSTFSFDALGRNVKIVEAGSTSGTKQFVWCGSKRCEERDGGGSLTKQLYSRGEIISGTPYFFTKDHLGSVREMSHMSGSTLVVDSQFGYDPFGVRTQSMGTGATPDDGFAGMYEHARSALNLTFYRPYSSSFGRWLSRDPLPENFILHRYAYVQNRPINQVDPMGLIGGPMCPADPCQQHEKLCACASGCGSGGMFDPSTEAQEFVNCVSDCLDIPDPGKPPKQDDQPPPNKDQQQNEDYNKKEYNRWMQNRQGRPS